MNQCRDALKGMRKIRQHFVHGEGMELRITANHLIKKAVSQDNNLFAELSITAYVLHKLLSKEHVILSSKWPKQKKRIERELVLMERHLENCNEKEFGKVLKKFHAGIFQLDNYFGRFIQSLADKARVKYAADVHFMGISLGQASELLSADKKTLLEYVGATKLHEKEKSRGGIAQRLRKLKKVVG